MMDRKSLVKRLYDIKDDVIGMMIGWGSMIAGHEAGHYVAIEALGGRPIYEVNQCGITIIDTTGEIYKSALTYGVVSAAGCLANYAMASGAILAARKTKRVRLKKFLSLFSLSNSMLPAVYSFCDTFLAHHGDFSNLYQLGVPPEVLFPTTMATSAILTYLGLKNYRETIGKKKYSNQLGR